MITVDDSFKFFDTCFYTRAGEMPMRPEQVPCLSTKMVMCRASDLLNIQLEAFRSETFHIFLLATRDNCIGLFYL